MVIKYRIAGVVIVLVFIVLIVTRATISSEIDSKTPFIQVCDSCTFELKRGDILVRPNWSRLPGSYPIPGGHKFGHVAMVVAGAKGKSIEEVLQKSIVLEALFYDQAKGNFEFDKTKQIRKIAASISFGPKFKGLRYRLRLSVPESKIDSIIAFQLSQLGGGYQLFSFKKYEPDCNKRIELYHKIKHDDWHCATLVWEAVYLTLGIDLDANQGVLIYPSDLIGSKFFDKPGARIRF
jgi:hypothetical protein